MKIFLQPKNCSMTAASHVDSRAAKSMGNAEMQQRSNAELQQRRIAETKRIARHNLLLGNVSSPMKRSARGRPQHNNK